MLGYNRLSTPLPASRRARRAAAGSVSATKTSSGIVSAREIIRVLGWAYMSVLCPILRILVRKIPNSGRDALTRSAPTPLRGGHRPWHPCIDVYVSNPQAMVVARSDRHGAGRKPG